jgi:hypothetical protein
MIHQGPMIIIGLRFDFFKAKMGLRYQLCFKFRGLDRNI